MNIFTFSIVDPGFGKIETKRRERLHINNSEEVSILSMLAIALSDRMALKQRHSYRQKNNGQFFKYHFMIPTAISMQKISFTKNQVIAIQFIMLILAIHIY